MQVKIKLMIELIDLIFNWRYHSSDFGWWIVEKAMDKQAAAERNRREKVLNAEGLKRAMELELVWMVDELVDWWIDQF